MNTNVTPDDLDDEELRAYADEYAALADFEDIAEEEWSLSDLEEPDPGPQGRSMLAASGTEVVDVDMDMS